MTNFYKETPTGEKKILTPNVHEKYSNQNRSRVNLDSIPQAKANLANEILIRV